MSFKYYKCFRVLCTSISLLQICLIQSSAVLVLRSKSSPLSPFSESCAKFRASGLLRTRLVSPRIYDIFWPIGAQAGSTVSLDNNERRNQTKRKRSKHQAVVRSEGWVHVNCICRNRIPFERRNGTRKNDQLLWLLGRNTLDYKFGSSDCFEQRIGNPRSQWRTIPVKSPRIKVGFSDFLGRLLRNWAYCDSMLLGSSDTLFPIRASIYIYVSASILSTKHKVSFVRQKLR